MNQINHHRRAISNAAFITAAGALTGVGLSHSALAQSTTTTAQTGGFANIKIGVLPNLSARALLQLYQPMRQYFERVRNTTVEIQTAPDFVQFYRRCVAGQYDIAITGSHMGRLANIDHGHGLVSLFTPDMRCLVVVNSAKPITSIADLKGKSISFANSASIVAITAIRMMTSQGLRLGTEVQLSPVSGEDSIAGKLLREDVVAAFMSMGEFRAIPEDQKAKLSIFSTYQEIPAFVVSKPVDLRVRQNTAALADFEQLKKDAAEFNKAPEARLFQQSSGFAGMQLIRNEDLARMDSFVEDTRRLMLG